MFLQLEFHPITTDDPLSQEDACPEDSNCPSECYCEGGTVDCSHRELKGTPTIITESGTPEQESPGKTMGAYQKFESQ